MRTALILTSIVVNSYSNKGLKATLAIDHSFRFISKRLTKQTVAGTAQDLARSAVHALSGDLLETWATVPRMQLKVSFCLVGWLVLSLV